MDMFNAARITALLGAAALVSACASTKDDAPLVPPPASMNAAGSDGTIPDYCPRVSLREGTAILRKGDGAALQYVASITSTTRDCRIVDGQLKMKIGVAGRVVPGPAAKAGEVGLPIRVVIVRGTEVLYSQIGSRAVTVRPGGGAEPFVYVDQSVSVPEPTEKDITVYAGFDEGPKK
jgi:hypothetical protein